MRVTWKKWIAVMAAVGAGATSAGTAVAGATGSDEPVPEIEAGTEGTPAPEVVGSARPEVAALVSPPTNQIIVGFTTATEGAQAEAALSAAAGVPLQAAQTLGDGAMVLRLPEARAAAEVADIAARLRRAPGVAYAEPDAVMQIAAAPTDPLYGQQWHYKFNATTWGANLEPAWNVTTGAPVVVAVLDTGRLNHPDLAGKMNDGVDMISNSFVARDGDVRDADESDTGDWTTPGECFAGSSASNSSWHGTHVAGTIGAVANNGQGGSGVSWGARVLHVRVLGRCGGFSSDVADGIRWAAGLPVAGVPNNPTPAKVINLSLGGSGACSVTYQNAINAAVAAGAVIAIAAGNSAGDAGGHQPGNCANVITVAAGDREGNLAWYSNFSPSVIEITAPGGETSPIVGSGVLSTLNGGATSPGAMGYAFYQGTSMATPHVAGVLALMKGLRPTWTPAQLTTSLLNNARPFKPGGDCATFNDCGRGWLDAGKVMQALAAGSRPTISIADVSTVEGDGGGTKNMVFTVRLSAASTSNVTVRFATANGTAVAPGDYNALALTTLTFTPGQLAKTITVQIKRDAANENNETFRVNLSNAVNANLPDTFAIGTIVDDD